MCNYLHMQVVKCVKLAFACAYLPSPGLYHRPQGLQCLLKNLRKVNKRSQPTARELGSMHRTPHLYWLFFSPVFKEMPGYEQTPSPSPSTHLWEAARLGWHNQHESCGSILGAQRDGTVGPTRTRCCQNNSSGTACPRAGEKPQDRWVALEDPIWHRNDTLNHLAWVKIVKSSDGWQKMTNKGCMKD